MRLSGVLISIALLLPVPIPSAFAAPQDGVCSLPEDLQSEVTKKYPGGKVVSASDLQDDDRKFFEADHENSCPGLVRVDFYGDGKPTVAFVLIPRRTSKEHTELIVARHDGERWKMIRLGTGGPSPNAPVVWSQPPGEYRDVYGNKTIRATRPVIVFCKYESWSILYAWTDKHVSKIWLSD